jgi:hypothetical protein
MDAYFDPPPSKFHAVLHLPKSGKVLYQVNYKILLKHGCYEIVWCKEMMEASVQECPCNYCVSAIFHDTNELVDIFFMFLVLMEHL